GQDQLDRLGVPGAGDLRFDRLAVALGQIADLHQGVDEEAQPDLGRQPPGGGMRRIDEAELFEIGHDIAYRRRGQRHRQDSLYIAPADWLTGRQIALDDQAKDLARALIELSQAQLARDQWKIVAGQGELPCWRKICPFAAPVSSRPWRAEKPRPLEF